MKCKLARHANHRYNAYYLYRIATAIGMIGFAHVNHTPCSTTNPLVYGVSSGVAASLLPATTRSVCSYSVCELSRTVRRTCANTFRLRQAGCLRLLLALSNTVRKWHLMSVESSLPIHGNTTCARCIFLTLYNNSSGCATLCVPFRSCSM